MKEYVGQMLVRKDLLLYLVSSGLKAQHRNSFLGYLWWLLNPLLGVLIYYFMVAIVFQRGGADYVLNLVIGLTVWRWLQAAVSTATRSIVSQAGIISQVYLPKAMFPLGVVLTQLVNFGFGMIVVALFLAAAAHVPGLALLWLPLIVLTQFLLLVAICMVIAYVSVFVRDMENVVNHVLQLWFYVSPIIWTGITLPAKLTWVLAMNPMAHVVSAYRDVILHNTNPNTAALFIVAVSAVLAILTMIHVYSRYEHRLIKVL
ncbi:MAG TPA: ABC transporter permease [Symbiobacteriaceae bacterium]|nr:ABC transporter permease [Symbiobacteriaceae bacterium]